jgi:predicted acylesterase/phospholipase RssA
MRFTNLVLGGGAARCTAFLGFLDAAPGAADAANLMGVSAGAIVAYVAAIGLPFSAALEIVQRHSAKPWDMDIGCLLDTCGMADNRATTFALIDELTRAWWWDAAVLRGSGSGAGEPPRTFLELGKRTGRNLVVPAVDVDAMRTVFFSMDTHPDTDVRLAIAASCAVPLLFSPVVIDGRRYVDGCLLQPSPFPALPAGLAVETLVLNVFARGAAAGEAAKGRWEGAEAGGPEEEEEEEGIFAYGRRVIAAFMNRDANRNRNDALYFNIDLDGSVDEAMLDGLAPAAMHGIFLQGVAAGKHFLKTYKHVHAVPAVDLRGRPPHRGRHAPEARAGAGARRRARRPGGDPAPV